MCRAASGIPNLLVVLGGPGMGKTALITSLREPLSENDGYLASGKFDLYRRDRPYAGILAALETWIHQVLTDSDASLAQWKQEAGRLIRACAQKRHPLVLLLDDLQWADSGSRYLLEELLGGDDDAALLVVATCRDNETDADHPVTLLRSAAAGRRRPRWPSACSARPRTRRC